jgi:cell division protein FtsB
LGAEVANLKVGLTALEERARSELGMVAASETFYQVVRANTPVPAAPAAPVTARVR